MPSIDEILEAARQELELAQEPEPMPDVDAILQAARQEVDIGPDMEEADAAVPERGLPPVDVAEAPVGGTPLDLPVYEHEGTRIGDLLKGVSGAIEDVGGAVAGAWERPAEQLPITGKMVQSVREMDVMKRMERLKADAYEPGQTEFAITPGLGVFMHPAGPYPVDIPALRKRVPVTREDDLRVLTEHLEEQARREKEQETFGGKVGAVLGEMPSFIAEFALTLPAARGVSLAVTRGLRAAAGRVLIGRARGLLPRAVGWMAGAAVQTMMMPGRVGVGYAERLQRGEKPASAFYLSFMDTLIENASEVSSVRMAKGLKWGVSKIPGVGNVGVKLGRALSRAASKAGLGPVPVLAKRLGWNGMIGEIGEERLGEAMRAVFGVEDYPSLHELLDRLSVEAVAFPILGGAMRVGAAAQRAPGAARERGLKKEVAGIVGKAKKTWRRAELLAPGGAAQFKTLKPEDAARLAAKETPSRTDIKKAIGPTVELWNEQQRAALAAKLRALEEAPVPEEKAEPEAAPEVAAEEPAPEAAPAEEEAAPEAPAAEEAPEVPEPPREEIERARAEEPTAEPAPEVEGVEAPPREPARPPDTVPPVGEVARLTPEQAKDFLAGEYKDALDKVKARMLAERNAEKEAQRKEFERQKEAGEIEAYEIPYIRTEYGITDEEAQPILHGERPELGAKRWAAVEALSTPQDAGEGAVFYAMPGKEKAIAALAKKAKEQKRLGLKVPKPYEHKVPGPVKAPKALKNKEDLANAVAVAAHRGKHRYALNAINVEKGRTVATDGKRMFIYNSELAKPLGLHPVEKKKGAKNWKVVKGEVEGHFPPVDAVIPEKNPIATVNIEDTLAAVLKAAVMESEDPDVPTTVIVVLNTDGTLGFAAGNEQMGFGEVNVQDGYKILGAHDADFVSELLEYHAKVGDTTIEITWEDGQGAMRTDGDTGKAMTITMPVAREEGDIELPTRVTTEPQKAEAEAAEPVAEEGEERTYVSTTGAGRGLEKAVRKTLGLPAKGEAPAVPTPDPVAEIRRGAFRTALDEILTVVAPSKRSEQARQAARLFRRRFSEREQQMGALVNAVREAEKLMGKLSDADAMDFIARMEAGTEQATPERQQIADTLRKHLDEWRVAVQDLGTGKLRKFYEHYFPHLWKRPGKAKPIIAALLAKRPFEGAKGFLKKRTHLTFADGIEADLVPVTFNPVTLTILKINEMSKYVMAHKIMNDLKEVGLTTFVYAMSKGPAGYAEFNDTAFTLYAPPFETIKEAYDEAMMEKLLAIATRLHIKHTRVPKMRGAKWGTAKTPSDVVETRFAGPVSVLAHEIGHILEDRYGILDWMREKEDTGKEAIARRKIIDTELRALADARSADITAETKGRKKYLRKWTEKAAVMLEALIHAPDVFKDVAPTVYERYTSYLAAHPEIAELLEVKPSLVLGSTDVQYPISGLRTIGRWMAPAPVALLLNNHLAPGLRNSKLALVRGAFTGVRVASNAMIQAELVLSLFHVFNTTMDVMNTQMSLALREILATRPGAATLRGIGRLAMVPLAPVGNLFMGDRLMKEWKKDSKDWDPRLAGMMEALIFGGARAKMNAMEYNQALGALAQSFHDIFRSGDLGKAVKGAMMLPVRLPLAMLEVLAAPVLQWVVPRQKLGAFYMMAKAEMQRLGTEDLTDERLAEALTTAWDSVDNRFGQLVYDNLFWNKTFKDALMVGARSVSWNFGSWREFGGAVTDIVTVKGRVSRGDAWLSHRTAYAFSAAVIYYIIGSVTHYLLLGRPPEEYKDAIFIPTGETNPDGTPEKIALPTYAKDWYAWLRDPVRTFQHKLNPIWGALAETWANEDFYGTEIRHPGDPAVEQLIDVAKHLGTRFTPFSVRNYQRMREAGATKERAMLSFAGVIRAPASVSRSPAHRLMMRHLISRLPRGSRTRAQFEHSRQRYELIRLKRAGEDISKHPYWRNFTEKERGLLRTAAKSDPFVARYKRLSFPQALDVYAVATKKEQALIKSTLRGKRNRAMNAKKQGYKDADKLYHELMALD